MKFWWVASWNIHQNLYKSKVYQKQKIKFHHLNTCSVKVVLAQQNNTVGTHSWCGRFHQVAAVQCWQPYNILHPKELRSASQTEERRNNRDRVHRSLGLCSKLSLYGAGWNPGISLEQGQVYHASVVMYFKKDGVLQHISLCIILTIWSMTPVLFMSSRK